MQWITLTLNQRHSLSAQAACAASIHTEKLIIAAEGNFRHFDTERAHIFVVGLIQHPWFDAENCIAEVAKLIDDTHFIQKLNGYFSVIVISKAGEAIRALANRSGGLRLYFHESSDQITISSSLINLTNRLTAPKLDYVSLREELEFRWLTSERSLVADIYQLQPGTFCDLAFTPSREPKIQYYWKFPARTKLKLSTEKHVENVFNNLSDTLHNLIRPNAKIAVLLSGGVDSSLLAGMLKHLNYNFVAFSHKSKRHKNPELDDAITFAKALNVEHRIIEINDDEIPEIFQKTTDIVEQAPRFQSSLILYKLFEAMSGEFDQVLYGEAADTLYGSNMVKRYATKLQKRERLKKLALNSDLLLKLAACMLPSKKLRELSELTPVRHITAEQQLSHSAFAHKWINELCSSTTSAYELLANLVEIPDTTISKNDLEIAHVKAMNLRSDIANHMHETGALANHFSIDLLTPFMSFDMVSYASQLDDASYLGNDFVKPVLRQIGEKFYPKHLMYLPKKGFPAPHIAWMENELKPIWQQAMAKFQINDGQISDTEFMWTLSSMLLLFQKLKLTRDFKSP
jgi:asparagine synthase (glutamine-hydrolysing)